MKDDIKHAILSTDIAVLTVDGKDLKVLLINAKTGAFKGKPALPGGLVKPKETIDSAAKRILKGIISVSDVYCEQLYTFGDPKRDPIGRVVSVAYLALVPWNKAKLGIKEGSWWERVKFLPKLAYDHNEVVKTAVKRLMNKLTYTNIVFILMPREFTLPDLQKTYEIILDKKLDKRNFRKKIFSLKILNKLSKVRKEGAFRPARLYSFKKRRLQLVEIL